MTIPEKSTNNKINDDIEQFLPGHEKSLFKFDETYP